MDIAQLILSTMEESGAEKAGNLGEAMLKYAKEATLPTEEDLIDDELALKVNEMKEYEANDDLGWCDFPSWNSLPIPVQTRFSEQLDPLVWSGVYFSFNAFMEKKEIILKDLDEGTTICIQRTKPNYRFLILNTNHSIYNYFSNKDLDKVRDWYNATKYMSIGRTITQGIVIRRFASEEGTNGDKKNDTANRDIQYAQREGL